jgi:multiple sugar transport system substrate-binding protein
LFRRILLERTYKGRFRKVSILHIYRKFIEKSRVFFDLKNLEPKRIDHFLFFAAVLAAGLFMVTQIFRYTAGPNRTELILAGQCEALFGKETVDALIREFEERNPELRIRLTASDSGAKNRSGPDIIIFDEDEFNGLNLSSLNSYMHTESGAEQQAIPLVSFMDLLFYNIELLKAAGFDRPPKTRTEFLACARAVSAAHAADGNSAGSGIYGAALGLSPRDPQALRRDVFSWIWAAGGELRQEGAFGGKTVSDVLDFLGQLKSEGALAPGSFEKTGAERLEEFARGKIALMIASARVIPALQKEMGGNFGITVIPGSAGPAPPGKNILGLSGIYAGISAASAHPDEAWGFLIFLAEKSPVLSAKLKAVPGSLPGPFSASNAGAVADDYKTGDPIYSKARDIFEASDIPQGFAGQPLSEEFERIVRKELNVLF